MMKDQSTPTLHGNALMGQQRRSFTEKLREKSLRRPTGRPAIHTPELERELLDRLIAGRTLTSIVEQDDDMPSSRTVNRWCDTDPDFDARLDRAIAKGQHAIVDHCYDILSGGELSTGDPRRDADLVKAIQWIASRHNRSRYGERVDVDVTSTTYTVAVNPRVATLMAQPVLPVLITDGSLETTEINNNNDLDDPCED